MAQTLNICRTGGGRLSAETLRMIARAGSGNSVVAPISTMASIRSRCCVAMWSRVMPPVLMPIALKRVTPS